MKMVNVLVVSGMLVIGAGCVTTVVYTEPVRVAPVQEVVVSSDVVLVPVYPLFEYDVIWIGGVRHYRHREEYRHSHEQRHEQRHDERHQDNRHDKKNQYNQ